LTQTLHRANEKAADFINRWRNLRLHCPHPITEPEAVWMCMNNLSPNMAIYLQGVRPITFKELSSKATDIENYMQHISRQGKSHNKPVEKNLQWDKLPIKPKNMQAMETTIAPRNSILGAPPRETRIRVVLQLLGDQLSVSVKVKSIPSPMKRWRTSLWVLES
jgi:hypothetical protein